MKDEEIQKLAEIETLKLKLAAAQHRIAVLEARANEDALLGVLNRRGLEQEILRSVCFSDRYKMVASVIYIDLDRFKSINDEFGHDAGDCALRHFVSVVEANIRNSDRIARIGGDEFVVLLWDATKEVAENKARGLGAMLMRRPMIFEGREHYLSISTGVAELTPNDTLETVLLRADQAMYECKRARRKAAAKPERKTAAPG